MIHVTSGISPRRFNWSGVFDNILTVLSILILVLSIVNVAAGKGETSTMLAARFWHVLGGLLRTVARTAGHGALQAESAYWAAIERVRG